MAFARFELSGQLDLPERTYRVADRSNIVILRDGGPQEITRRQVENLPKRRWTWDMVNRSDLASTSDQRQAADDFLVKSRKFGITPFLVHDPKDPRQVDYALGTGTGAQTVFPFPTTRTSEVFRHYPFDDASVLVYPALATVTKVDGVVVAGRTIQTDARTVTFSVAPGGGLAVTISYDFYRLALFVGDEMEWEKPSSIHASASPEFEEILRDG